MIETTRAAVNGTIDALKGQPLLLAVIVLNALFLGIGAWIGHSLMDQARVQAERRDAEITKLLARDCVQPAPKD